MVGCPLELYSRLPWPHKYPDQPYLLDLLQQKLDKIIFQSCFSQKSAAIMFRFSFQENYVFYVIRILSAQYVERGKNLISEKTNREFPLSKLRQDWDRNFMWGYIFFTTSCQPTAIFVCHVNTTIPLYPFYSSLDIFITHSGTFVSNLFQISKSYTEFRPHYSCTSRGGRGLKRDEIT